MLEYFASMNGYLKTALKFYGNDPQQTSTLILHLPPSVDVLFSSFLSIRLKHAEQHLFTSDGISVKMQ